MKLSSRKNIYSMVLSFSTIVALYFCSNFALADQENQNVKIRLAAEGQRLWIGVENNSSLAIKTSRMGNHGNAVVVVDPSGDVRQYVALSRDLSPDYIYTPYKIIDSGKVSIFNSTDDAEMLVFLEETINRLNEEGVYLVSIIIIGYEDFSAGKFLKHTSNQIKIYVGKDGKKTFVNDPEALKAFQKHSIELGNSADKMEVEKTAEGNYLVRDKSASRFSDKVAAENESEWHLVLAWIVGGIFVLGLGYFILKRSNQPNEG